MKNIAVIIATIFIASSYSQSATQPLVCRIFQVDDQHFIQYALFSRDESYPRWKPSDSACPLESIIAIDLAVKSVTNSIPEIKSVVSKTISLEPQITTSENIWYYKVIIYPKTKENKPMSQIDPIVIAVGINGEVPEIQRIPQEELTAKRKENVHEILLDHQLEVIKNRAMPFASPLSNRLNKILLERGMISKDELDKWIANQRVDPTAKTDE